MGETTTYRNRYAVEGWTAETDLDNPDDREGVHYLTVTQDGEEFAVIVHRTVDGKYPLDGEVALAKEQRARHIAAALNLATGAVMYPHPDIPCAWCGEYNMDENACPNAKDICNDCCGED